MTDFISCFCLDCISLLYDFNFWTFSKGKSQVYFSLIVLITKSHLAVKYYFEAL